jgi:hypothetical protein
MGWVRGRASSSEIGRPLASRRAESLGAGREEGRPQQEPVHEGSTLKRYRPGVLRAGAVHSPYQSGCNWVEEGERQSDCSINSRSNASIGVKRRKDAKIALLVRCMMVIPGLEMKEEHCFRGQSVGRQADGAVDVRSKKGGVPSAFLGDVCATIRANGPVL